MYLPQQTAAYRTAAISAPREQSGRWRAQSLSGTRRTLGGYAVLLSFLLRIGQTHRAVKGLAQRLAVDISADGDLVLEPFVFACWLFSWHKNNPFLTVKKYGKIEVLMAVVGLSVPHVPLWCW